MLYFENQIENLNLSCDLSAFLFHLGLTYHKSQTILCSHFSADGTQDKSVHTHELSSQLMLKDGYFWV